MRSLNSLLKLSFVFFFILSPYILLPDHFSGFKDKSEKKRDLKEAWKIKLQKHRIEKNIAFKKNNTSPLAGKARLIALKDGKYYLNKNGNSLFFQKKKDNNIIFSVLSKENNWILDDTADGIKCFKGKTEIRSGGKIQYRSLIKIGKYTLIIYPLEKYLIATVFDPDREIIKKFNGLKYYPLNYKFYVDAEIKRIDKPEKVIMLTSRDLEKTFYRNAKISFIIDNTKHSLFAYSSSKKLSEEKILFIPFTDKTTGQDSYYTGRYLEIDAPLDKFFKLDFNLAFNPLCNYSPAYNCAIPPQENELIIKIEAGEKTYPVKGH